MKSQREADFLEAGAVCKEVIFVAVGVYSWQLGCSFFSWENGAIFCVRMSDSDPHDKSAPQENPTRVLANWTGKKGTHGICPLCKYSFWTSLPSCWELFGPRLGYIYGLGPPSLTPTLVQVHFTKLSQHSISDTVPVFEKKWERLKGSVTPNLEVTLY